MALLNITELAHVFHPDTFTTTGDPAERLAIIHTRNLAREITNQLNQTSWASHADGKNITIDQWLSSHKDRVVGQIWRHLQLTDIGPRLVCDRDQLASQLQASYPEDVDLDGLQSDPNLSGYKIEARRSPLSLYNPYRKFVDRS